jgi:Putative prokaryotic signal transducing protein
VHLTVVASQGEADVICSFLRSAEIKCADRATDMFAERGGGFGGWREILVEETDLAAARELLASAERPS